MNLFSSQFIIRHQRKMFFVIIWLHISILDLFYVTYRGPVFLWQKNAELLTLVVHFGIALATLAFYLLLKKISGEYQLGKFKISNKVWLLCSICLFFSITFLIF
ncbi:MAG: hypothetical protein OCD00_15005 [Colwellia sp.]